MGFFSKIKENFTHGGVKLQLAAPASVSMQDAQLPVTVTVQAGTEQVQIDRVDVEIIAESQDQSFGQPTGTSGSTTPNVTQQVVAQAGFAEPFVLAAGEVKQVPLSITMNVGASMQSQLPEGSALAGVAHALQGLQSVSEALNHHDFTYTLRATAKVDGILLGPQTQQSLQILRPGQVGGAINIGTHL